MDRNFNFLSGCYFSFFSHLMFFWVFRSLISDQPAIKSRSAQQIQKRWKRTEWSGQQQQPITIAVWANSSRNQLVYQHPSSTVAFLRWKSERNNSINHSKLKQQNYEKTTANQHGDFVLLPTRKRCFNLNNPLEIVTDSSHSRFSNGWFLLLNKLKKWKKRKKIYTQIIIVDIHCKLGGNKLVKTTRANVFRWINWRKNKRYLIRTIFSLFIGILFITFKALFYGPSLDI